eukprot:CAMPEP_0185788234 /NCGR_PEP_ID=MMETSP1174-20130828/145025_1 /TAXON_ID=35687 /ORGANISM="Dictyocha speculum, Strain CCMP1381" /LENGTH=73 /DNA_ID=CAMNT_0028481821 /DNA_START=23 /DNA_END=241 /DNA_ORIENTATION=+
MCNFSALMKDSGSVNGFSVTTYHLNVSGLVSPCNGSGGCGWTGDPALFNKDAQAQSQGLLRAVPLVFNNAGNM